MTPAYQSILSGCAGDRPGRWGRQGCGLAISLARGESRTIEAAGGLQGDQSLAFALKFSFQWNKSPRIQDSMTIEFGIA